MDEAFAWEALEKIWDKVLTFNIQDILNQNYKFEVSNTKNWFFEIFIHSDIHIKFPVCRFCWGVFFLGIYLYNRALKEKKWGSVCILLSNGAMKSTFLH